MNDQTAPPAGAAAALLGEARARFESDLGGAREEANRALGLARAEGDAASIVEAHILLGECDRVLGDHARSLTCYGAALDAAHAAGDSAREAEAHRLMAFLHDSIGRFEEAHAHHLAALGLLETLGDERGMAHVLRTIGVSASKSRDHEQGLEWYRKSLAMARRAGDEESVARTLTNIGLDLKNLGQLEESLAAHEEAVAISRRLGKRRSLASQLGNFAHTLALLKRDAEAEAAYRESIAEGRALEYPAATGNALVGLGRLCVRLGRVDEARALLNEGLALAEGASFRPDVADALEALVMAEKRAGDPAAALAYYERFHQLTRAIAQDESRSRLKGLELRLRVDQSQREATEERRRSHELAQANERLQAAAAEKNDLLRLLQRQTREDALTGLANRRHFDERLSTLFAEAKRAVTPLALALIDIDHFQRLTDSYTQAAGDSTLLEVARILRAHVGEADIAARIGPESFAILFAGCDLERARRACDAIRAEVEAHDWAMIHQWLKVTVSMGVAQAAPDSAPERLLTEADMRLRAAKEAGRNRVFAAPVAPFSDRAAAGSDATRTELPDPRRALILAEQVRSSYQNLPIAYAAGLAGAVALCFVVRDLIPARVWASWLAAMFAVTAGLGFLYRAYSRAKPTGEAARRWGHYATTGALLAGSLWGLSAPLLHTPDSIDYQIMVASTAAIVGSSVAFASATYLPPFFFFFFPAVLPTAIVFLSKTENTRFVFGLMLLLYLPIVTRFAVTLNRAFIESLRLRFQNVALVGELRERKDAAERANLAKSRFLAAASHDLRQPMHALGLFLQALRQGKLAERERKLADNIGESFDAMDGLFNALLDISRLDAGVVEPRAVSFPVARLLDRMRTEYGPQAARKGLSLSVYPSRAVRALRSRAARGDRGQPGLQRDPLHRRGARGARLPARGRGHDAHRGLGHRPRHPARQAARGVPRVHPARQSRARPREGPRPRARDRRAPVRADEASRGRALDARARFRVPGAGAARRGRGGGEPRARRGSARHRVLRRALRGHRGRRPQGAGSDGADALQLGLRGRRRRLGRHGAGAAGERRAPPRPHLLRLSPAQRRERHRGDPLRSATSSTPRFPRRSSPATPGPSG